MLLSPPWSILTWSLPDFFAEDFWQAGLRVAVPLGKGKARAGMIVELAQASGLPEGAVCREIIWPLESSPISGADFMALIDELARRQGLEPGYIAGHILPKGLRSTAVKVRWLQNGAPVEYEIVKIGALSRELRALIADDFSNGGAWIVSRTRDSAEMELCQLRIDPPWPLRPAATRQRRLLDYLHEHGVVSRRRLLHEMGESKTLQAMVGAGYVEISRGDLDEYADTPLLPPARKMFELNEEQQKALDELMSALAADRHSCHLLYGVTGSGKTAIYMELARACLELGKSVILLAPEVALACKLARDAAIALPNARRFLYHGYQTPMERERIYRELAAVGEPCVVAGTRSALFLPIANPGCIILDEEHDGSFKQDEIFGYHAKEVAWFKAARSRCVLLLGSATPDIKTFHAAKSGSLPVLSLRSRYAGQALPPVELVNIGARAGMAPAGSIAATAEGTGLLAPESEQALMECMLRGEQAVVMLNRRGYAPMIYCLDCGKVLRCPHCEIGLSLHKGWGRLVCHYCGYSVAYPSACQDCGKMNHIAIGEGTERLAERLEALTGRQILRLDRDSTRRPGRTQDILEAFARGESPFLVGTQMLSKGHHFPNVTLVVVADGDIGLNLPDYRAAERTFQLLVQSAGRAGRGSKSGHVLIQTRDLSHYCWEYVKNYDYEGFYEAELARRKRNFYPPFTRLAILRVSFAMGENTAMDQLAALGASLRELAKRLEVRLLGPAPAPIAMLRGHKRYQFLLKSQDWDKIRKIYFQATRIVAGGSLRLFLDLDPVNML